MGKESNIVKCTCISLSSQVFGLHTVVDTTVSRSTCKSWVLCALLALACHMVHGHVQ